MSAPDQATRLLLHLSGDSSAQVVSLLSSALTECGAQLLDLSQSRLSGLVAIGAVVTAPDPETCRVKMVEFAGQHQLRLDVHEVDESSSGPTCGLCVTLLGDLGSCRAVSRVTTQLGAAGLTINEVRSLGSNRLDGLEMLASKEGKILASEFKEIRATLLALGPELGIDLGVQRDNFYRKNKRLLCMDVDSTFVKGEFIDELADLVGVKEQVAAITARAMRGELEFQDALRERVKLLKGLPMSRAMELCDRFELTPGADELIKTVKQLGMRVGLVSGGFDFFVEMLKERFNLDFAFANELEVEAGVLTGKVAGTIVDGARKAQVLKDMSHVFGVRLEQTIAAGDGANDILMLQTAGLGIAYQAKPRLQEVADSRFNHHDRLDTLFYLMGFDAPEVVGACND